MLRTESVGLLFQIWCFLQINMFYCTRLLHLQSVPLFKWLTSRIQDDVLIVYQVESLSRPMVAKEVLDLLQIKRSLIAFSLPLLVIGVGIACDSHDWMIRYVAVLAGLVIFLSGVFSFLFAVMTAKSTENVVKEITAVATSSSVTPEVASKKE
jgi:hypothetical protein